MYGVRKFKFYVCDPRICRIYDRGPRRPFSFFGPCLVFHGLVLFFISPDSVVFVESAGLDLPPDYSGFHGARRRLHKGRRNRGGVDLRGQVCRRELRAVSEATRNEQHSGRIAVKGNVVISVRWLCCCACGTVVVPTSFFRVLLDGVFAENSSGGLLAAACPWHANNGAG